jgi:2-dehydro-3-deoxygluconokinase
VTDVVTFGEAMVALRSQGPLQLGGNLSVSVAGAESNVAIGLTRLGHSCVWVGRVGDDEFGSVIVRALRGEGVSLAGDVVDPFRPTGAFVLERRLPDLIRVRYYRAGSAGSTPSASSVLAALSADVRLLHLTGITPALSANARQTTEGAVARARELGITVSFDVNFRSRLWSEDEARPVLSALARSADVVFASERELPLIEVHDALACGLPCLVVKRGPDGAVEYGGTGSRSVSGKRVAVADPVGAGDGFVTGYLSGLLDGLDADARLERGVIVGAFAVSAVGDWEGLPTREELRLLDAGATLR